MSVIGAVDGDWETVGDEEKAAFVLLVGCRGHGGGCLRIWNRDSVWKRSGKVK